MAGPEVKDLFYKTRFVGGWHLLAVVLYFPIGVILALLRVFISLQAYLLAMLFSIQELTFMRQFVLRVMSLVLGIFVVEENPSQRDESVRLLIANQTTSLDHVPVHLVTGCFSPSPWDVWPLALKCFEGSDKSQLAASLRSHAHKSGSPLLLQPEEATTNSRVGLLRFAPWCLSVGPVVQPLGIRTWRPLGIANSTLTASFSADLFWFFFTPVTVFHIRYLPVVKRQEGETEIEMADRVAKGIAHDLGLAATNFTAQDKCELEKRHRLELARQRSVSRSMAGRDLRRMAGQVAEVLPYVPYEAIVRDISRTHNVDLTISNILEGHVQFTPVTEHQPVPSALSRPPSAPSGSTSGEASSSFPRSAQDRMMSFVERKTRLIEEARRRYMEKHGLTETQ